MDKEKTIQSVIGIGAVSLAAYLAYTQLSGEESQSIGGSGAFSGLGGGESLTEEGISGTSDSGVSYNINLPQVDTSGISALVSGGSILDGGEVVTSGGSGDSVITGAGDIKPVSSKKSAVTAGDSTKAETSGSLSSSLAQVFGTPAQRTNKRGDYYTTPAGGGAGAIKGQSLGEIALNILSGKTSSGKSVSSSLPTGASTADSGYTIPSSSELKSIFAADTAKKEAMATAISQTKIAAPVQTNLTPYEQLQASGLLKSSSGSASATTTKKEAVSTPAVTTKKTVSLSEAKNSSRIASTGTSKKVIKVKK